MKRFFGRQEETEEIREDLDVINLDETAEWSKLDIAEEMIHNHEDTDSGEVMEQEVEDSIREDIRREIMNAGKKESIEEDIDESIREPQLEDEDIEYLSDEEEEEKTTVVYEKRGEASRGKWSVMDKIVAATGIIVLVVAITTVCFFFMDRGVNKQIEAFAPLGEQMETLGNYEKEGEEQVPTPTECQKATQ